MPLSQLANPQECDHAWQPVTFVFETEVMQQGEGTDYKPFIRQPDCDKGSVYCVCMACASHTYIETSFIQYKLDGSTSRPKEGDCDDLDFAQKQG